MLEYVQSVANRIPFKLEDSDGNAVTGKIAADLTCYFRQADGTVAQRVLNDVAGTDGALVESDSANMPGHYDVQFSAVNCGQLGAFSFCVTGAGVANVDMLVKIIDGEHASTTDVANLDVAVSSRSSHSAADVWAVGTRELTASLDPTAADVAAAVWASVARTLTANPGLSASQVAAAVWDELQAGHVTPDTFGEYLDSPVSEAGDATAIAAAVWNRLTSAITTAGTIGDTILDHLKRIAAQVGGR